MGDIKRISITIYEHQYSVLHEMNINISRIVQRFLEYYLKYGHDLWRILDDALAKEIIDAEVSDNGETRITQ